MVTYLISSSLTHTLVRHVRAPHIIFFDPYACLSRSSRDYLSPLWHFPFGVKFTNVVVVFRASHLHSSQFSLIFLIVCVGMIWEIKGWQIRWAAWRPDGHAFGRSRTSRAHTPIRLIYENDFRQRGLLKSHESQLVSRFDFSLFKMHIVNEFTADGKDIGKPKVTRQDRSLFRLIITM